MPKQEKEKTKKEKGIRPRRWKYPKLSQREIDSIESEREEYRNRNLNYGVPPDRTYESWPYPTGGS